MTPPPEEQIDTPADAYRERARVMIGQGRWDLAESHLRALLAVEPDDAWGHACLAMNLGEANKHAEALVEADRAIAADPQYDFGFYVRAMTLSALDKNKQALRAIEQAVELDPDDADNHALHAALLHDDDQLGPALSATDRALALEPENATALNLRGMILTRLGRHDDARAAIDASLAVAPESHAPHSSLGQLALRRGDSRDAIEHFTEALRIDPRSEIAKAGFIEALKAQNPVYRALLRFVFWLDRQRQVVRWTVIIGLIVGRNVFRHLAKTYPDLAPVFIPLAVLLALVVALTWVADPLFNLLVRFHPLGKHALTSRQKAASNWLAAFFVTGLVTLLVGLTWRHGTVVVGSAVALLMPIGVTLAYDGAARRARWVVTAVLLTVAFAAAVVAAVIGRYDPAPAGVLIAVYGIGCLCSPLLRFRFDGE